MNYIIDYYSNDLQSDILNLPEGLLAKYFALSERMEYHGANLGEPHTKAMGGGLFELRLKSTEGIARVFYCTRIGRRIVMLHSFIKKTQKTPLKELKIAQTRMREIKDANP